MIKVITISLLMIAGTSLIYDSLVVSSLVNRVFDQNILLVAEEIERQKVDNPSDPLLHLWREMHYSKGRYRINRFAGQELKFCFGFLLLVIGVRLGYKFITQQSNGNSKFYGAL